MEEASFFLWTNHDPKCVGMAELTPRALLSSQSGVQAKGHCWTALELPCWDGAECRALPGCTKPQTTGLDLFPLCWERFITWAGAGWSSVVLGENVSVGRDKAGLDKEMEAEMDALGLVRYILHSVLGLILTWPRTRT